MLDCPDCNGPSRIVTSKPTSSTLREYYCQCKDCDIRFLLYGVFENFIVENSNSAPPNEQLQPKIAKRKDQMLQLLSPTPKPKAKPAMRFL